MPLLSRKRKASDDLEARAPNKVSKVAVEVNESSDEEPVVNTKVKRRHRRKAKNDATSPSVESDLLPASETAVVTDLDLDNATPKAEAQDDTHDQNSAKIPGAHPLAAYLRPTETSHVSRHYHGGYQSRWEARWETHHFKRPASTVPTAPLPSVPASQAQDLPAPDATQVATAALASNDLDEVMQDAPINNKRKAKDSLEQKQAKKRHLAWLKEPEPTSEISQVETRPSNKVAHSKPFNFLGLPYDIREKIYRLVLLPNKPTIRRPHPKAKRPGGPAVNTGILLVNKLIHREARLLLSHHRGVIIPMHCEKVIGFELNSRDLIALFQFNNVTLELHPGHDTPQWPQHGATKLGPALRALLPTLRLWEVAQSDRYNKRLEVKFALEDWWVGSKQEARRSGRAQACRVFFKYFAKKVMAVAPSIELVLSEEHLVPKTGR